MKVGLAQVSFVLGDFPANVKRMMSVYREMIDRSADVVLVPAYAMSGGWPGRLLERSNFSEKEMQAMDFLSESVAAEPLILYTEEYNEAHGRLQPRLYVLHDGKVKSAEASVLDQDGQPQCWAVDVAGKSIIIAVESAILGGGGELCEQLESLLVANEVAQPAALVCLCSHAYSWADAPVDRESFAQTAAKFNLPLIYLNEVGGRGDRVMAGGSFAVNSDGSLSSQLQVLADDLRVINLLDSDTSVAKLDYKEAKHLLSALVLGLRDFVHCRGVSSVVLHADGSLSSQLAVIIARLALGDECVLLAKPAVDSSVETSDSTWLYPAIDESLIGQVDEFARASWLERLQSQWLMTQAESSATLVISSVNKLDYQLGEYVLGGRSMGHLSLLADCFPSQLQLLADYLQGQGGEIARCEMPVSMRLPCSELVAEEIITLYREKLLSSDEIIGHDGRHEDAVRWIKRRLDLNEWKGSQMPPILRVTSQLRSNEMADPVAHRFFS